MRRHFLQASGRLLGSLAAVALLGLRSGHLQAQNTPATKPAPEGKPPPIKKSVANIQPELRVDAARLVKSEGTSYAMAGDITFNLSATLADAIGRGVPLVFKSEFELLRPRWYGISKQTIYVLREAQLTLHPVSGQFRVKMGDSTQAFVELTEALRASLALKGWEVIPNMDLTTLHKHSARVRLSLESAALPKPFFISALTSERWGFDTGWLSVLLPPLTEE